VEKSGNNKLARRSVSGKETKMSMRDRANETASNISEMMNATPEQEKAIKDEVYSFLLDLRVEFLRVSSICLDQRIISTFYGEGL
jgi:hypothetical protein